MKKYKAPELEIVKFSHEDIITVSAILDALVVGKEGNSEYSYEGTGGKIKYRQF